MLVGLKEILAEGKKKNIAVGAFNTPTLECLLAVLRAAEDLDVPVIIAHFQGHDAYTPIDKMGKIMIELAKMAKVNVCVHLDHGEDVEYLKKAIDIGFTSVMIDKSHLPYEENVAVTADFVKYAHSKGVDVEAELGMLPNRETGGAVEGNPNDLYTDPNLVNDYIDKTGVDALAIAFGTAHGIYKVKPVLCMDIVSQVAAKTDVPLVMHGGSGISHEEYREVIKRGISKINYYTYMSYAGYKAVKEYTDKKDADFVHELTKIAEDAMYEKAYETMKVFAGK